MFDRRRGSRSAPPRSSPAPRPPRRRAPVPESGRLPPVCTVTSIRVPCASRKRRSSAGSTYVASVLLAPHNEPSRRPRSPPPPPPPAPPVPVARSARRSRAASPPAGVSRIVRPSRSKQPRPQFPLQGRDLPRHRRLRQTQRLRRARKAPPTARPPPRTLPADVVPRLSLTCQMLQHKIRQPPLNPQRTRPAVRQFPGLPDTPPDAPSSRSARTIGSEWRVFATAVSFSPCTKLIRNIRHPCRLLQRRPRPSGAGAIAS